MDLPSHNITSFVIVPPRWQLPGQNARPPTGHAWRLGHVLRHRHGFCGFALHIARVRSQEGRATRLLDAACVGRSAPGYCRLSESCIAFNTLSRHTGILCHVFLDSWLKTDSRFLTSAFRSRCSSQSTMGSVYTRSMSLLKTRQLSIRLTMLSPYSM